MIAVVLKDIEWYLAQTILEWTPLCPNNHVLFLKISRQVGQVAGIVKLDCEAGEWLKNTIVLLSIRGEFFLWKEA